MLFSYTCRDGSEVPADAFRIGSLSVITKAFHDLRATGPAVEDCLPLGGRVRSLGVCGRSYRYLPRLAKTTWLLHLRTSMLDYVRRSVQRSPAMMREPGDGCNFLRQLGR